MTVGVTPYDHPDLVRENLARHALPARIVDVSAAKLPFADGTFDVVTWNALYDPSPPEPARIDEVFRVLKSGGKVIGLFPASLRRGLLAGPAPAASVALLAPARRPDRWDKDERHGDSGGGSRRSRSHWSASGTSAGRNCRTRGACFRWFCSNASSAAYWSSRRSSPSRPARASPFLWRRSPLS